MKGKRLLVCLALLATLAVYSGCGVIALGPVPGAITIDQRGPVAVGPARNASKMGTSEAQGILLVSWGDASIKAAADSVGISSIHHVDCEVLNILGIYARYETIVYGE